MKNKKVTIGLVLICVLGVIGGTIAYFSTTDTFDNIFGIDTYKMEVYDIFESPSNWRPGDTTPREVVATNKGDLDAAVRISFEEEWKDEANNVLPLTDSHNVKAALIDIVNDFTRSWIKSVEDGKTYYYYRTKIGKDESTTSLVESITFNPLIEVAQNTNCVDDTNNHSSSCSSVLTGYSNGHYKLTVKVETVQFNKYKEAWNTNVNIDNYRINNLAEFVDSLLITDSVANDDPDHNVRFIGTDPNNYVWFNNESWRMIGEFNGRVKLIREERFDKRYAFDFVEDGEAGVNGHNYWGASDLMNELNGDYLNYNLTEDPIWKYYYGYTETFDRRQGMKQDAQELIDDAIWYLGAPDHETNGYADSSLTANMVYMNERAGLYTVTCSHNDSYCAYSVDRQPTWTGKVGLMYPSDFLYATSGSDVMSRSECINSKVNGSHHNYDNGECGKYQWIKRAGSREWTISPSEANNNSYGPIRINTSGGISSYQANAEHDVRPVVFLKSNVIITGGTGSKANPFTIGL